MDKSQTPLYGRYLVLKDHDEFGPVEVVEDEKHRSLHFGNPVNQSEMSLNDPYALTLDYTRVMAMALLFHSSPRSVLNLGVGGGSIPKFLWKYFPECHLDLVERSPLVADISYNYFSFPKDARLQYHIVDALDFLKESTEKYDLIFIDLFQQKGPSEIVLKPDFFRLCQERARDKNSIIICHLWSTAPKDTIMQSVHKLYETFGKNMLIVQAEHNSIVLLIFSSEAERFSVSDIVRSAERLESQTHLNFPQLLLDHNFFQDSGFIVQIR
jgi:spermidine synthase